MSTCWKAPFFCRPNMCGENGRCVEFVDSAYCDCDEGWAGEKCMINIGDIYSASDILDDVKSNVSNEIFLKTERIRDRVRYLVITSTKIIALCKIIFSIILSFLFFPFRSHFIHIYLSNKAIFIWYRGFDSS